uniref:Iron-binding zinc finger CDGSH type domain-containing protein n=1 Tax=Minutocellus polymorphus TaxID=265543 RepID=A0A6U4LPY1_9STRA|mmetsp:Transcript_293/g.510  ORF Transcript_293/g.510 Transcript_293/m.510 type:complete len:105 (+) Transcript_293:178-492(+)
MKSIAILSLCASASAFAPLPLHAARNSALAMADDVEGPGKINGLIDLDSPKVVNNEVLEAGKKGVYCRCWLSGTFPACDGTHAKHNDATGDNVGPLIVSAAKGE